MGGTLIWDYRGRGGLPTVQICPLLLSSFPLTSFPGINAGRRSCPGTRSEVRVGGLIGNLDNWTGYNLTAHTIPPLSPTQDWWQVGRLPLCVPPLAPLLRPLFYLLDFAVLPQNWSNLPPVASENLKTEGGADSLCSSI